MSTHIHFAIDAEDGCRGVGRGLRTHRLAQDITQAELAARSGVSQATLKRIETAGQGSLRDVVSIARCLGLTELFSSALFEPPLPTSIDEVIRENHRHVRKRASPARRGAA